MKPCGDDATESGKWPLHLVTATRVGDPKEKSLYAFPASQDVSTWTSTSSSNDAFVVGSSSYASIAKNKQILNKRRHDTRDEKKQQKIAESLKSQTLFLNGGRGCGCDGRAVASEARSQRFESQHRQKLQMQGVEKTNLYKL